MFEMFVDKKTIQIREDTAKPNSARLKEFQTHVMIVEKPGGKVINKYASTHEAMPFLKLIVQRERKNVDYLGSSFDVLCGELKKDHIEYDYLPYKSLQEIIAECLGEGNDQEADRLLGMYVDKLNSLNKVRVVPEEFLSTFEREAGMEKLEVECLSQGLLDLVPHNILVDHNRWIVLDNEWSFDFPVPVIYILFRAIRMLGITLQTEIRQSACKTYPVRGVFASGFQTNYLPVQWLNFLEQPAISLHRMLSWEVGLKQYVLGSKHNHAGKILAHPKTKCRFFLNSNRTINLICESVKQLLKKIPGLKSLVRILGLIRLNRI